MTTATDDRSDHCPDNHWPIAMSFAHRIAEPDLGLIRVECQAHRTEYPLYVGPEEPWKDPVWCEELINDGPLVERALEDHRAKCWPCNREPVRW